MPYLGRPVTNAGQFEIIDDISSGFDGSETSFTLQVGGTDIQPDAANVTIVLDGVVQIPSSAYSVTGSTLNFSEAPTNGTEFHGVLAGQSQFIESGFITNTHISDSANISGSKINTDFSAQTVKAATFDGMISGSAQLADDISGSFSKEHLGAKVANVVTSSAQLAADISGSFGNQRVGTSDSPTFAGGTVTGDFAVGGTLTAQEVHTEFESASILFTSGSTQFGNSSDDVHDFKGNKISGSITSTGSFGSAHFMGTGGVGIGTNNPDSMLHVVSAGSPSIRVTDTTNTVTGKFQTDNSVAKIGTHTNHSLELFTNNNTALTINNSQNAELAGDLLITDNSDTPLTFKKTSNGEMFIRFLNQDAALKGALIYRTDLNQFSLRTDNTTALSIDSSQEATFAGAVSASGNISIIKGNAMLNVEEIGGSKAYLFSGGSFTALRTTSNTPLQFGANYSSTDTMYIVGDKVGIGTNNPSYPLTISDGGGLGFEFSPDHAGGGYNLFQNYNRAGSAYVPVWYIASEHKFYSGGTEVAQIDSSGNVGIGTDNPGNLLHVEGDLGGIELHSDSHRIGRIVAAGSSAEGRDAGYFSVSYGGSDTIIADAYGYLIIDDQGRDRVNLELRSSNDVNHGMTNYDDTTSYFTVKKASTNGGIGLSGYTGGAVAHEYNARYTTDSSGQSTSTQAPFNFRVQKINGVSAADVPAGKNLFTLRNNGTTRFIFNADGTAYAADSWTTFSDERLKKDVKDMSYGLEEINKLKPKTFILYDGNFDEEGNVLLEGDGKKQIGFIAQEMKEIVPEMISNPNQDLTEGFYALDDGKLTSVLVKAVQELSQKNEALEKRIQELEK